MGVSTIVAKQQTRSQTPMPWGTLEGTWQAWNGVRGCPHTSPSFILARSERGLSGTKRLILQEGLDFYVKSSQFFFFFLWGNWFKLNIKEFLNFLFFIVVKNA